jgi:hypothetical protein
VVNNRMHPSLQGQLVQKAAHIFQNGLNS